MTENCYKLRNLWRDVIRKVMKGQHIYERRITDKLMPIWEHGEQRIPKYSFFISKHPFSVKYNRDCKTHNI